MKTHLIPCTVAAMALFSISCEKKETAVTAPDPVEEPAEVSQHEKLATQLMDRSQEVFDIVLEVKDLQSANMASGKIINVADQIDSIYKELNTLGPASESVKPLIQEKLKERDKVMLVKRIEVNQLLESLPDDATQVIVSAMSECSKVMEANLPVFKRCFGIE